MGRDDDKAHLEKFTVDPRRVFGLDDGIWLVISCFLDCSLVFGQQIVQVCFTNQ